ncbi:hypothetical protein NSA47_05680 [Irregularibacter muris]|uniref:Uncharacterized protein n=1 Tax=Irregularibacter muris TaxID=1796619 RepID=A0AAE3HDE1_9FIRM|nr:hypothetical protein [Irregularibacter muris]MCR1898480.1 hypothetical protein [Irregularibacter muris]
MPKRYENPRTRIIIYILILSMFGVRWVNTYRVKSMNSLFDLRIDRAKVVSVSIDDGDIYGRTKDEEKVNEVKKHLKPLKVRRMLKNEEAKVKDFEEGYVVELYEGDFLGGIAVYKNNKKIISDGSYYYKITKGEIDQKFIEDLWNSLEEKYGEK